MSKINLSNMIAYIQGNVRYQLYYSKYKWLIPGYILEQIDVRIKSMNEQCYHTGSCIMCGCRTTHLQMANKPCEGACYPVMMDKRKWKYMKKNNVIVINNVLWYLKKGMFKKLTTSA